MWSFQVHFCQAWLSLYVALFLGCENKTMVYTTGSPADPTHIFGGRFVP